MIRKPMILLLATAGLLAALPAYAQEAESVSQPPSNVAAGYRVDSLDGGFALVTHGIWVQPQAIQPADAAIVTSQLPAKRNKPRPRSVEPSFRRAAYLPHV